MTDQKLVDELEKALTDEAYDGGMGALSGVEFSELVRTLAVTAAEVVEKAGEPEWEYRVAGDGGYRTTPGSLDHAMKCVVGDDRIERRTKEIPAGPWVPVKQEDDDA